MKNDLTNLQSEQGQFDNALEDILRHGARKMLQQAIEAEVAAYTESNSHEVDENGHRKVTRNGHLPSREVLTGIGPIEISQPRVRDARRGETFTSAILPKYARRTPSVETVIPALYLKGVSTGDMSEALEALLGDNAKGLSPTNVVRLKSIWEDEYKQWDARSFEGKHYVYVWADGIYTNVRLSDDRPCILVLIGALEDGTKELIAVHDGQRESKLSWKEVLQGLKRLGLEKSPHLAVGDGALGFWAALREEFPSCKEQRCWVHKTANILDKMPKSVQPSAKKLIHEMYMAPTKKVALKAYESFLATYGAKYTHACNCLQKDKEQLFTFYDFPAQHWIHIRTTNPIESTFATVRHRTRQTKGGGSRQAALSMVFKMALEAERSWHRLNGYRLITKVIEGVNFKDGEEVKDMAA